jgi:hypothetical protein
VKQRKQRVSKQVRVLTVVEPERDFFQIGEAPRRSVLPRTLTGGRSDANPIGVRSLPLRGFHYMENTTLEPDSTPGAMIERGCAHQAASETPAGRIGE